MPNARTAPPTPSGTREPRRRGDGRVRLLEAAATLFNDRGYEGTTTREIATRAGVSETLLFRYYGSKAELFRVSMVEPFVAFVQSFVSRAEVAKSSTTGTRRATREFVAGLYEMFGSHRGLVAMFSATDVHVESELAESGLLNIVQEQFDALVGLFRHRMAQQRGAYPNEEITTRITMAMVAAMATFGRSFYGSAAADRDTVIDEITEMIVRGHSRRPA